MPLLNFSIHQPFGIYLFNIFDAVYSVITGSSGKNFSFTEGVTPLSTLTEVITGALTYYLIIFGGRHLMQNLQPIKCKRLFQIHNVLLTATSAILLVLIVEQVIPKIYHHGFHYSVCSEEALSNELETLYYLNYLVKYWELLDTVFLVIKKKKLEFLHYFHHSMTMALCYTQLAGRTPVSYVPITLNLSVHVLMYYYYYRTASGAKIWWKKYLTGMQITQFVIDLGLIYSLAFSHFIFIYANSILPSFGTCAGSETAAIFGCFILTSYLVLFINFYRLTYNEKAKGLKQKANAEHIRSKLTT
ncbi:fatty acid elongase [Spinellus fusiger]|nr:fatty acid elongase [Spinellus fusiger]